MKVTVHYTAQLRTVVGEASDTVELPEGCSLLDLLVRLASIRAEAAPHLVAESGAARPSLLCAVNDAGVSARESATKSLHDGDIVTLLPPIAGG